ncbi:TPA: InlB B-repeat-containing protein, partial [Streptococcus suis]
YLIRVEATSPDGQGLTASTTVRYEEGLPELENFIMRHNGYEYNLKEHGDKAPVISFRPGGKFEFEVEYTNTSGGDSLYLISTREGMNKVIELNWDVKNEKYVYTGYFDEENTSYVPGKMSLYFEKDVVPTPHYEETMSRSVWDTIPIPMRIDTDGDGFLDSQDKNPETWDVGDRDLALFAALSYMSKKELELLFPLTSGDSTSTDKIDFDAMNAKNEPISQLYGLDIKKTDSSFFNNWHFSGTDEGVSDGLFNVNNYSISWFTDKSWKNIVIAIRGTDEALELITDSKITDNTDIAKYSIREAMETLGIAISMISKVRPVKNIYITGHSLGGYLSYHAAYEILTNPTLGAIKNLLTGVVNFNGPGVHKSQSEVMEQLKKFNNSEHKFIKQYYVDEKRNVNNNVIIGGLSETTIHDFAEKFGKQVRYRKNGFNDKFAYNLNLMMLSHALSLGSSIEELRHFFHSYHHNITSFFYYLDQGYRMSKSKFEFGVDDFTRIPSHSLPQIKYIIDPSGIITNADSNLPVRGATTTVYYRGENGEEVLWDAGEYSQLNPLSTTVNGEYAWDVPEGYWKVKVEKAGYESAESEWLPVPPPQTEVHFKLKPHAYTIAYNAGEGSMPTTGLVTTYKTDVAVALPQPTRKGYKFAGWFEDSSLTGVTYLDTLFLKPGDKTLFAKWERATKLLGTEAEDAFIHLQGDDVDKVARLVKAEQTVSTLAVDLPEGVQESDVQLLTIQLLDAEGQAVSLTEPARMEIGLETERPPVKVLTYNSQDGRFEEVVFDWDGDLKELQFDLQDTANYLIVYQPLSIIITRTRQEVRVLTTDQV